MNTTPEAEPHLTTTRCAVCGKTGRPPHAFARLQHHGTTVHLCSPSCLAEFRSNPAPWFAQYVAWLTEALAPRSRTARGTKPDGPLDD